MTSGEPWRLLVAGPVKRRLAELNEPEAAAVIETFERIAAQPLRVGKPLKFELEGLWSARRGPYRVLYEIDSERHLVTVVAVGHRADIYRRR